MYHLTVFDLGDKKKSRERTFLEIQSDSLSLNFIKLDLVPLLF